MGAPAIATGASSVRILDGGAEAFPRMLAAIDAARETVHLEVYAFALDATGERFVEALSAAARRGVRVQVVVDGVGSALDGRRLETQLGSAGAQLRIFNPLRMLLLGRFRRDHRKLLLVDDEVAFVGGINVGDEYGAPLPGGEGGAWADLAAEVRGPACAWLGARLRRGRGRGRGRPRRLRGPVRIWLSGLGGGWPLRRRYLKAIGAARRAVFIAHGYFLPDRRLVRTITAAARRGVAVTLLLPGQSDIPFARQAAMRLYGRLLAAGVRIYEWEQSILHAKAAATDGERLLLGSFNLDPLSLANLETLVEIHDPRAAGEGQAWIARHVEAARAIERAELEGRSLLQRWLLDVLGLWAARTARLVGWLLRR
ncbi:MAG TPA: phospholipase D-like domain-containing protein [Anaeromyxobacteraceae bacterium]|nr:phospholipase D-like domain-containing protein [Anaeromyxobacteraceae bacterium]